MARDVHLRRPKWGLASVARSVGTTIGLMALRAALMGLGNGSGHKSQVTLAPFKHFERTGVQSILKALTTTVVLLAAALPGLAAVSLPESSFVAPSLAYSASGTLYLSWTGYR